MFEHHLVKLDEIDADTVDGIRTYHTPDGDFPSVTTVLKGFSQDGIQAWKDRVGEEEARRIGLKAARQGTNVHEMAEMYVRNVPYNSIINSFMPHEVTLFKQLKEELDEHLGRIAGIEVPLYSKHLRVGGRCDLIGEWDGELAIIDHKTTRKEKKEEWLLGYYCQCAAYAVMFEELTKIPINKIVILIAASEDVGHKRVSTRDAYINEFIRERKNYYKAVGR